MISAIIYSSTTGSCKKYAEEMSRMLHIPAVDAKKNALPKGMEVIYVGWLLGGKVVGLAKVRKDYVVKAVVQVGMGGPNPKSEAVCREKNGLLGGVEVFTLQGRFDMDGLPLPLRLVMKAKCREIAARLRAKGELTEAEQATLRMAETGKGEPATWDGVQKVVDWAAAETNPPEVIKWSTPV